MPLDRCLRRLLTPLCDGTTPLLVVVAAAVLRTWATCGSGLSVSTKEEINQALDRTRCMFRQRKQFDEAKRWLRTALDVDPTSAITHNDLALLYKDLISEAQPANLPRRSVFHHEDMRCDHGSSPATGR